MSTESQPESAQQSSTPDALKITLSESVDGIAVPSQYLTLKLPNAEAVAAAATLLGILAASSPDGQGGAEFSENQTVPINVKVIWFPVRASVTLHESVDIQLVSS